MADVAELLDFAPSGASCGARDAHGATCGAPAVEYCPARGSPVCLAHRRRERGIAYHLLRAEALVHHRFGRTHSWLQSLLDRHELSPELIAVICRVDLATVGEWLSVDDGPEAPGIPPTAMQRLCTAVAFGKAAALES